VYPSSSTTFIELTSKVSAAERILPVVELLGGNGDAVVFGVDAGRLLNKRRNARQPIMLIATTPKPARIPIWEQVNPRKRFDFGFFINCIPVINSFTSA
jgi:hypothetical protein